MKLSRLLTSAGSLFAAALLAGCSSAETKDLPEESTGDAVTATDGTPLEFRFEAQVVARADMPVKNAVIAQLEYLQGILTTGPGGNAQFRFVDVKDARSVVEGDKKRWTYNGSVAVVYPVGRTVPRSYDLALPLDVTALDAFNAKYDGKCGKNEYGQETFWHDFNPKATGCVLGTDVHQTKATVRKHPLATTDKYPEYDQMLADDALDIVAVYGSISNTSDSDTGARDREAFLGKVQRSVTNAVRKDEEERDGILKESTVTGDVTVAGKVRKVKLTAYFVSEAKSAGSTFDRRYEAASEGADIVIYSGHSGLGTNIAWMANHTKAKKNKYQVVFLNGCQTFGYLGPKMHEDRIALNGRETDPNGTKYLDVIVTALPAYSERTPTEQVLFDAALEQTKGWGDLLKLFSGEQWTKHLTAVFGEDDNAFRPR